MAKKKADGYISGHCGVTERHERCYAVEICTCPCHREAPYVTKTGKVLTDADIETIAAEYG